MNSWFLKDIFRQTPRHFIMYALYYIFTPNSGFHTIDSSVSETVPSER